MKRILSPALLLLCLLFLPPNRPKAAHQARQGEQQPQVPWQPVRAGVRVLKIWEITDLQWPRIVILRLSVAEYENFLKDPIRFLNIPEIYGSEPKYKTHKVYRAHLARVPKVSPGVAPPECVVTNSHGPDTTTTSTSSCPTP